MELFQMRDAARELGVSYPTLKQWIYRHKIRSVRTPGGHHWIPRTEIDRIAFFGAVQVAQGKAVLAARARNQDYSPVLYPIAMVKDSGNAQAAKEFLDLEARTQCKSSRNKGFWPRRSK